MQAPAAARRSTPTVLARGPFGPVSYPDTLPGTAGQPLSLEERDAIEDQQDLIASARVRARYRDEITDQLKVLFPDQPVLYYEKFYGRPGWTTGQGDQLEVRRFYPALGVVVDAVQLPVRMRLLGGHERAEAVEREILHRREVVERDGTAYVVLRAGSAWEPVVFQRIVSDAVERVLAASPAGGP